MTTILTVRHQGKVALGGDGQVTLGNTVMKADAAHENLDWAAS